MSLLLDPLLAVDQRAATLTDFVGGVCELFRGSGLPIDRCWIGTTVLHPQAAASAAT